MSVQRDSGQQERSKAILIFLVDVDLSALIRHRAGLIAVKVSHCVLTKREHRLVNSVRRQPTSNVPIVLSYQALHRGRVV